jgi:hypothetical protein
MNTDKRLRELERRMVGNPITLVMRDGTRKLVTVHDWPELFHEMNQGRISPTVQAIQDSVSDNCFESGNGRMTEVVRAFAEGEKQFAAMSPEELAALDRGEGDEMQIQKETTIQ